MDATPEPTNLTPEEAALLDGVTAQLRDRLDRAVQPELIVLQGLVEAGCPEALTDAQAGACGRAASEVARARREFAGIDSAIQQAAEDARLFDSLWPADAVEKDRAPIPRGRRSIMRWPARIGLGLSAVLLIGVLYLGILGEASRTSVTAPTASVEVVELGDGTQVRLSPGSTLTYVPGGRFDRMVELSGMAWFDVAHDARQFAVQTSTAVTTVLGTRFSVEATDASTEVVLVSGRVAVSSRANRTAIVTLEPGQSTVVPAGGFPEQPRLASVAAELAWLDLIIFRETPMLVVAEELASRRDELVELGPGLADQAVTGTFSPDQTTAQILDILAATLGASVERTESGYRLTLQD